ncbi:hypothetical protein F5I97DRAFT_1938965 [Phlebopus sp. FC_14]|nr:hypothetical protein F5I97DRAFT_1938965 [Phlebopus sp. FC_14]
MSSSASASPAAAKQREPSPDSTQDPQQLEQAEIDDTQPTADDASTPTIISSAGPWQAVFSPQHGAYYFYNSTTGETTWVNPLQPSSSSSIGPSSSADPTSENPNPYDPNSMEARALAAGIDPSLAHLDPSLAGPSSLAPADAFTAKFNARTGAFTPSTARAPSHLSEYERAKRMSEFYFDVGAWERDIEQRVAQEKEQGQNEKKRKRPTKKDLERFKEQKRLKKIAKTAWLRT